MSRTELIAAYEAARLEQRAAFDAIGETLERSGSLHAFNAAS